MTAAPDPLAHVHLPAAFEPVHLAACDSAMDEAIRRARGRAPEGTLVWVDDQSATHGRLGSVWASSPGGLHCAVVLRPDVPAERAGEFLPLGVLALGAAIATLAAPLTELGYRWPNAVFLGGGRAGGAWLAHDPDWLVLAVSANVAATANPADFRHACISIDGGNPDATAAQLLEAYAYQLLGWLARWDDDGLAPAIHAFRSRVLRPRDAITLCLPDGDRASGYQGGIDDSGALMLEGDAGVRRITINEYMGLPRD